MSKWLSVRVQAILALVMAATFGLAGQAQARWLKAETDLFVVYSDGDEKTLREFATKLDAFDGVLRVYSAVDPAEPVRRRLEVYLVGERDLGSRWPGINPDVAGFYSAGLDSNFAVAARTGFGWGEDVLFHEYTHHFMYQYRPYPYPGWLTEGWAEYYMTVDIQPEFIGVGLFNPDRASALNNSLAWLPIRDVLGKRGREVKDINMFYSQAWLLTHYMNADPERRRQLAAYTLAVGGGADPVDAMVTATGGDLAELERRLHAYQRGPIGYSRLARRPTPVNVRISNLPASADALLLDNQRLKRLDEKEEAPGLLRDIRRKAARFPGDRFADLVLARAELRLGDRDDGELILRRYTTGDAPDADALQLLGICRAAAGANAEARTLLAKADQVRPDDYRTLYAYAQTRTGDRDYPSDNTLNMLLLAHELAPQIADVTLTTAQALAARTRYDQAELMTRVVANDPHGGPSATAARKVLEQIAAMRASGGGRP